MDEYRPTKDTILWSVKRDHGFSNVVRAVFEKIYPDMDFDQYTHVNIHRLAIDLELWPKTVASALRQLERKGIICRGSPVGIAVRFKLNAGYGWIGGQNYSGRASDRPAARLSA
jgi:hypothetical protein